MEQTTSVVSLTSNVSQIPGALYIVSDVKGKLLIFSDNLNMNEFIKENQPHKSELQTLKSASD